MESVPVGRAVESADVALLACPARRTLLVATAKLLATETPLALVLAVSVDTSADEATPTGPWANFELSTTAMPTIPSAARSSSGTKTRFALRHARATGSCPSPTDPATPWLTEGALYPGGSILPSSGVVLGSTSVAVLSFCIGRDCAKGGLDLASNEGKRTAISAPICSSSATRCTSTTPAITAPIQIGKVVGSILGPLLGASSSPAPVDG